MKFLHDAIICHRLKIAPYCLARYVQALRKIHRCDGWSGPKNLDNALLTSAQNGCHAHGVRPEGSASSRIARQTRAGVKVQA